MKGTVLTIIKIAIAVCIVIIVDLIINETALPKCSHEKVSARVYNIASVTSKKIEDGKIVNYKKYGIYFSSNDSGEKYSYYLNTEDRFVYDQLQIGTEVTLDVSYYQSAISGSTYDEIEAVYVDGHEIYPENDGGESPPSFFF